MMLYTESPYLQMEMSNMECICKKYKGMTTDECNNCVCCEDFGNGVECDC